MDWLDENNFSNILVLFIAFSLKELSFFPGQKRGPQQKQKVKNRWLSENRLAGLF